MQDVFEYSGLRKKEKDFLDVVLVLLELEFPVGEGKQDRFFVLVPRISPLAEFANLAFNRVKDLAEDLVEVNVLARMFSQRLDGNSGRDGSLSSIALAYAGSRP